MKMKPKRKGLCLQKSFVLFSRRKVKKFYIICTIHFVTHAALVEFQLPLIQMEELLFENGFKEGGYSIDSLGKLRVFGHRTCMSET